MNVDAAVVLTLITGYPFCRNTSDLIEHFGGDENLAHDRILQQYPGLRQLAHMSGFDRDNKDYYLQEVISQYSNTLWIA